MGTPAFRFCLDNTTLTQARSIRYSFFLLLTFDDKLALSSNVRSTVKHHCNTYNLVRQILRIVLNSLFCFAITVKNFPEKQVLSMHNVLYASPTDSLQNLFDSAPAGAEIRFPAGTWREKAVIRTPGLRRVGAGQDETVFLYDDIALKKDSSGREYNTFRTWSLAVCADDVEMAHLAVVNDALHPELKGQEVALSVCGNGFRMQYCTLSSTQDTLFLGPLPPDLIERYDGFLPDELRKPGPFRQQFSHCRIEGTVDFIFGCGEAVFDSCEIRSLSDARDIGYAAAPAHSLSQQKGFLFSRCSFTCSPGVTSGSIFLARPWRDYGLCRFEDCSYGPHIAPEGFDKWNDTNRDRTARFYESPPVSGRVDWINRPE